jgi:hypothetical protein
MSPSFDIRESRAFASEVKFLIPATVAERVRHWVRSRLAPDPHGSGDAGDCYQVHSLYFDTEQFDVFNRRGSFGRCKYRIRSYGREDVVFLERKLKTGGLLAKRRSSVNLTDLDRLALDSNLERGWAGYWFHRRLLARRLKARCRITYRRTARVAQTPQGPIRLTLDEGIRALPVSGWEINGTENGVPLSESWIILELKFRSEMPVLFKLLVEEFALNPERVSKYRLAAAALGLVSSPDPEVPRKSLPLNAHA